ncbi:hypothetical protein CEXT_286271 [Caerostris extrusa]|uniref:Uncharacterized protein n=1 Tax=Caerostris extrusa TaxID=172846 RepID=A0AAV4N613_CAEEX|nr:hypothetical protein CEXT_286271 [Caerostris extrusa]
MYRYGTRFYKKIVGVGYTPDVEEDSTFFYVVPSLLKKEDTKNESGVPDKKLPFGNYQREDFGTLRVRSHFGQK